MANLKNLFRFTEWWMNASAATFGTILTRVRDKDCVKNRVKRAKIVRFTLC